MVKIVVEVEQILRLPPPGRSRRLSGRGEGQSRKHEQCAREQQMKRSERGMVGKTAEEDRRGKACFSLGLRLVTRHGKRGQMRRECRAAKIASHSTLAKSTPGLGNFEVRFSISNLH